ncbi:MAG: hypothetical protein QOG31_1685 [Thermoplasmata archaeon]|nr:hypothetical protein [Thermoplasmata archaeon]
MSAHERPPTLPALTSLRFFAALWVVLFHLALPALQLLPVVGRRVVQEGWLGVPFFFVLSGFILVHVYGPAVRGAGLDRRAFWWARLARVYPMYLGALAIAFPLFLMTDRQPPALGIAETVATPLLLQSWLPSLSVAWNHPAWSLSTEAFFYAVFPVAAVLLVRAAAKVRPLWLALGSLAAGLAIQALLADLPTDTVLLRNLTQVFPPWWLPFFLYGAALGLVRHEMQQAGRRVAPAWGLAVLAVAVACLAAQPSPLPRTAAIVVAEGAFGLAILGLSWPGAGTGWLAWRPLVELGEASYALYLIHIPLAAWGSLLLGRSLSQPAARTPLEFLALCAALVGASLALHRWFERPARRWLLRLRGGTAHR